MDGSVRSRNSVQFTFGSSKPLSRFVCRVDGGEWRECEEESTFPLTDGVHGLAVTAVDPSGRLDPSAVHYSWEVSIMRVLGERLGDDAKR